MISYLIIISVSFFTAGMTLYSGFGLGTLLMPVFALFFPIETAVAATAVVHGANNIFKISVVGKHADWSLVTRFGIPALLAAVAGASALGYMSRFEPIFSWELRSIPAEITPVKLAMGILIFNFSLFELLPYLRKIKFDKKFLLPGGLLSGFFGGFSGHQGALRSAFLVKVGISTQAFVGTSAMIGFMVDMARLATYAMVFVAAGNISPIAASEWPLIFAAVAGAFAGVFTAKKYLHKITMKTVQTLAGILLLLIAAGLGTGLI